MSDSLRSPGAFEDIHVYSDVDSSNGAQHHTLGPGKNQAAPGKHSHSIDDLPSGIGGTEQWFNGLGAPSSGLGANGDMYLDNSTGNVYEKQSGTWVQVANIKGPQGIKGDQGIQGNQGIQGIPGSGYSTIRSAAASANITQRTSLEFANDLLPTDDAANTRSTVTQRHRHVRAIKIDNTGLNLAVNDVVEIGYWNGVAFLWGDVTLDVVIRASPWAASVKVYQGVLPSKTLLDTSAAQDEWVKVNPTWQKINQDQFDLEVCRDASNNFRLRVRRTVIGASAASQWLVEHMCRAPLLGSGDNWTWTVAKTAAAAATTKSADCLNVGILGHEAKTDPHTQYLTQARADPIYVNTTGDTITGNVDFKPTTDSYNVLRVYNAALTQLARFETAGAIPSFDVGNGGRINGYAGNFVNPATFIIESATGLITCANPTAATHAATKGYVDTRIAAVVYLLAGYTLTTAAVAVSWTSASGVSGQVAPDSTLWTSASPTRFQCPVAGWYGLTGSYRFDSLTPAAGSAILSLYLNGSIISYLAQAFAPSVTPTGALVGSYAAKIRFNAGDYVEIMAQRANAASAGTLSSGFASTHAMWEFLGV